MKELKRGRKNRTRNRERREWWGGGKGKENTQKRIQKERREELGKRARIREGEVGER